MKKNFFNNYEFFQFFDRETQSKLYLLSMMRDANQPLSIDFFCQELGISRKTMNKYLYRLERDVERFSDGKLILSSVGGQNYCLIPKNIQWIDDVLWNTLSSTDTYQIWNNIIFETDKKIAYLSQSAYVSESTIWRKLQTLQDFLKKYDIQISKRSHRLIGEESQIRGFLTVHFWNVFRGRKWPFVIQPRKYCLPFIDFLESFFDIQLNQLLRLRLEYLIAVWLMRQRLGYQIRLTSVQRESLDNPIFEHFYKNYKLTFSKDSAETDEIGYLFLAVLSEDFFYQNTQFLTEWIAVQDEKQTELYQSICDFLLESDRLITNFHERFWINPMVKGYIWSTHLSCQLYKKFYRSSNGDFFWNQQQFELLNLKKEVIKFIQLAYKRTENPIFLEQEFLTYRYMSVFSLSDLRTYFELPINILITTDLPKFEETRLIERIQTVFEKHFRMNFIFDDIISNQPIDLVISTVSFYLENIAQHYQRCLFFSEEFTLEDYLVLGNELTKILEERRSAAIS